MEFNDSRTKTSLSIRPSLIIAAQRKMLDLNKRASISEAIEEALIAWVTQPSTASSNSGTTTNEQLNHEYTSANVETTCGQPGEKSKSLHGLLAEVLASGNTVAIDAIRQNLAAFALLVRSNEGHPLAVPADIAEIVAEAHRFTELDEEAPRGTGRARRKTGRGAA